MNPIEKYKRAIVLASFIISLAWIIVGGDFPILGEYTRTTIGGLCGVGLVVFLTFYKDEEAPTSKPEPKIHRAFEPAPTSTVTPIPNIKMDISKIIDEAHNQARGEKIASEKDIFSGFK